MVERENFKSEIVDDDEIVPEEPDDIDDVLETKMYDGKRREFSFEAEGPDGDTEVYAGKWVREQIKKQDNMIRVGIYQPDRVKECRVVKFPRDKNILKHSLVLGTTGHGKSTFNINAMVSDAESGKGFTFIDPKQGQDEEGNSVSDAMKLIQRLPEHRLDDVVYIRPRQMGGYGYNINLVDLPPTVDRDTDEGRDIMNTQSDILVRLMRAIGNESNWGALMGNNFSRIFNAAIRSKKPYTMGDIFAILNNSEYRQDFINDINQELDDDPIKQSVKKLNNSNDADFESLRRRIEPLVNNLTVRNMIFGENTDINFREILKEDKILIIDINTNDDRLKKILMGYITYMLYITSKSTRNNEHILYCDEFDQVLDAELLPIIDILKRGRSNKFLLWMSTQTPSALNARDPVYNAPIKDEADTLVEHVSTGKISEDDASSILDLYRAPPNRGKLRAEDIADPKTYHFYTQPPDSKNEKGQIIETEAFPPYPPRRTREEANEVIKQSMKRYGSPHMDYVKEEDYVRDYLVQSESTISKEIGFDIVDVATIYDTEHDNSPEEGYATSETIRKIVEHTDYASLDEFDLEQWLEKQIGRDWIETISKGKDVYYKLTSDGREQMQLSTGTVGSSGNEAHKVLCQDVRKKLAKRGIYTELEMQNTGGGEKPDGISTVFASRSERPFSENISLGDEFIVEVEDATTSAKPERMLTNLRKAYNQDKFVVFATAQNPPEEAGREENYEKIEAILERGCVREVNRYGERLYNGDTLATEDNRFYPLRKLPDPEKTSTNRSKWYISVDGESLKLMEKTSSESMTTIAEWNPISSFENWAVEDFPAYAEKDEDGFTIYDLEEDKKFKIEGTGDSDINRNTDIYRTVKKPYVPEIELGEMPERNNIGIIATPTAGRRLDNMKIYYDETFYDIGESPQSSSYTDSETETQEEDKSTDEKREDNKSDDNEFDLNLDETIDDIGDGEDDEEIDFFD